MGRIATTILPADTSSVPEPGMGVPGPVGGQFGQQWDEQQYAPLQSAYQYGNPDTLPQVKGPYKCLLIGWMDSGLRQCSRPVAYQYAALHALRQKTFTVCL